MTTEQEQFWQGEFGAEYSLRNTMFPSQLNAVYKSQYGYSRREMNEDFLSDLSIQSILEVGCNTGNQLHLLREMGYEQLTGIELQQEAVEYAQQRISHATIVQGSAFSLPFEDHSFDLVFTSGVLIHLAPEDLEKAMKEIIRVAKKYVWGFEYYDQQFTEIPYREHANKMWRGPYAQHFLNLSHELTLCKAVYYPYLQHPNQQDCMYLLKRQLSE